MHLTIRVSVFTSAVSYNLEPQRRGLADGEWLISHAGWVPQGTALYYWRPTNA